ncbi:MAG: hypothetical protein HGA85_05855, partial [Nanoarchaeota archaeon]|nr:hypothetical protein [Nanoarchaeota archaeon]
MFDALLQLIAISLALLCPGAIIILCLKKLDAISAVTLSILSTIAFWSSLVWLLRYIPISLLSIFYIVVLVTMLSLFYYRKQIDIKIESYYLLAAALAILILRLVPLSVNIAASGADMSMHTYITRLIVESGTLPKNYSPILDIPTFTSFPIGFHTISAIISLFTGIPSYRSAFIISCLSYALLSLSLYLFLKRHVSKEAAMSSSLIFSFLTWNPQGFAAWGGSPTILDRKSTR